MNCCPTPGKMEYGGKGEAKRAMRQIYARKKRGNHKSHFSPVEPYRCPCGSWHLATRRKR